MSKLHNPTLIRILLTLSAALCLFVSPALSQTGQITGRVTDSGGGVIPNATVKITAEATGVSRTLETNGEGFYTAPSLLPGTYTVSVEHAGFRSEIRKGLQLQVNQDLRLDFSIQVGSVNQEVLVTAEAPVLDTESHAVGQVVQSKQIVGLPLLGRNAYSLGALVPGVRTSRGMNDVPIDIISTASVSINGAPANTNEFLLDGAPNTAPTQNQPIIYPNPDSVQEFKVDTSNFSAEYGRAAGGIFNVVTKSGTNDFHFTLYEFLRNDKLNSSNWFANLAGQKQPPLKFNQFGGVLGGPVIRNRTFFFVSTELVRFIQGVTYTATVPTAAQLAGNFSRDLNSSGQQVTIYDPFSTIRNPNGSGFVRTAFPGNIIPGNRLNPVAAKLASFFPAANSTGIGITGQSNYTNVTSNNVAKNTFSARLDHNFTDATRAFVRYSYDDSPYTRASPYGPNNPGSPGFGPQDFQRQNVVVEGDHVFSPSLVGTLRASFSRLGNVRGPVSQGFDITQLGLPSGLSALIGAPAAFPVINITGYGVSSSVPNSAWSSALGETGLIVMGMNNYALQAGLSKSLNAHTLKMGGEVRIIRFNTLQTSDDSNNFSFTGAFTQGPNAAQTSLTAGDALASFLLGTPASGSVTPSPAVALQTVYSAGYLQDDWKVRNNFTLNLGLRYELETPRTERYNQLTNFDNNLTPAVNPPGLNLHGVLTFAGVNGNPRRQAKLDTNNFAPRIGFAWHVTPKTVIRAGAGIFYGSLWGIGGNPNNYGISGFTAATNLVSSLDGVTPANTLSNPYPNGLTIVNTGTLGVGTLLGQSVSFYDRNTVTGYAQQFNADIQRELPHGWLLDLGFVGLHGLKFPANRTLNQLPDSALALGDALRTQVRNPFYPNIPVGTLAATTVARAQLLVPYPQFTGVTAVGASWASSRYDALQVKLEKRYASGFTLLASYTYSKMLDYSTGSFSGETLGGGTIQDWNNLRAEWSPSSLDQTHRLILNTVYELPFFRRQQGVFGHILGGWELGVLGSFYSGSPLGITSSVNGTFSQGGGQRPNWNGVNPAISNPTVTRWFNPAVFSTPASYTFGTTPRTLNSLRSDYTRTVDLSLHKNTHITERLQLQIRGEAFNLANTPVFSPPNTSYGSTSFATVSSQSNQPRIVQVAMKLIF